MWFKAIRHAALVSVALQKCGQLLPNGDVKKLGVAADQQKWQRLGDKWKQKFPWLDAGISHIDGKWGVGCSDCYQAKRHGCSFARYTVRGEAALQCINFKKHDGNGTHTAASKHRSSDTHKCQDDQDFDVVNAPSREDFRKVISDIQKGLTPGCDRKSRAEQWCLLEGIKIIDQKHLEAAKGISLFRDESQGRLSLRFRSVGPAPKFETYSALMGQARDCGTGAKNITLGTIAIIERACSRFSGGDKSRCHQKEIVLKPLFKKVKKNIRCITVDSAGDELLSGEMMRNRSLIGSMKVHTPNLKYVIKDCTHASRRLGSRPTAADPYLKEVILMMVRSRSSMARIIQNSSEVQRIFKGHCKTSFRCIRNIVANMKSALHRFESMSKPLGRSCIFLHAMIKTALTLATVRTDEVGKRAGQWLMWLDTEKCLQSAMMADGHDQNLAFTRILDDEAVPAAVLNREASFFVAAIDELYVGDNPTCLKVFGYTSLMLEMLSRPLVWTYKNKIHSIGHSGGVPQFIIDACLRRMCNWVYLAKATVYAEFPNFELVNAMVVFDPSRPLSEADDVHLKRIALAINKSEDTLRHQFKDIKPRAQQNQSGNNDGWALAVQQIYATKSVFRSHPTDVLEDAMLLKYLIGLSSSGVEQLFSQTRWALGKQRLHAKDENEEMIIKLMADLPHHDLDKLINLAQRVWAMCFNPPKQSPQKPRIDKGVKRLLSDTDDAQPPAEFDGAYPTAESEAAFIRKRRRAIRQCVVKSERNLADVTNEGLLQDATRASTSGAMEWTEGHDKELKFIKNKIGCRKACALAEGQLLDIEITEEVREVARATRGRRRKDCQARERKAAGDKKKLQGLMGKDLWGQIKGTTVFIDRSVTGDHTPLIRALQANNMAVAPESELAYAAVFVTSSDRGSVSQRVNLASAVKGAFQISPELVMSSGAKGNAIKFFPAAMSKRCLYVSHAATQHHKELWSCFKKALASSPCVPRMVLELHENVADDKLGFVNTTYKHMPRDVIVRPGEATHPAKLLVVPNIYSHCNMIGVACHGWDTGLFVLQARVMCAY